jgi:phosphate transport system permease protein
VVLLPPPPASSPAILSWAGWREKPPILFTAAAYFLPRLPNSLLDQVMALPYHLYVIATSGTQIEKSRPMAYGTAVVLLFLVLAMNLLAVYLRQRFRKLVKN